MRPPNTHLTMQTTSTMTRSIQRREALRELLSMLHTDWTRDHLLGLSPTTDAGLLSSPLQQLHSISFESDTRFDPISPTEQHYNTVMSTESVLIPAFSKDGLNAGFILEDAYGIYPDDILLPHTGGATVRFLSRESNGNFLAVHQRSDADIVMHLNIAHRNGTFSCFGFPPNTLTTLITTGVTDVSVMECLLHSSIVTETRKKCTICGAPSNLICSCSIEYQRSKTPLDLRAITQNLISTQLGQCSGQGIYEEYKDGIAKQVIRLGSQHRSLRIAKQGSAKRLLNWAIGDVLKSSCTNVQRVISSPLDHLSDLTSDLTLQDPFSGPPLQLEDVKDPTPTSEISPESVHFDDPHNLPFLSVPPAVTAEKPQTSTTNSIWLSPVASTEDCLMSYITPESGPTYMPQIPPVMLPGPALQPYADIAPAPTIAPTSTGLATPIAPRCAKSGLPLPPGMTEFNEEKMQKTAEDLRAWKAYQRKIRNRESAARSNLARKQRRLEQQRRKEQSAST